MENHLPNLVHFWRLQLFVKRWLPGRTFHPRWKKLFFSTRKFHFLQSRLVSRFSLPGHLRYPEYNLSFTNIFTEINQSFKPPWPLKISIIFFLPLPSWHPVAPASFAMMRALGPKGVTLDAPRKVKGDGFVAANG